jgi:hypothetical protein
MHRLLCRSNHDRRIEGWDPREPRTNEHEPYESTLKQLFECLLWICAPALLYEVVAPGHDCNLAKFQSSKFL